MGKRSREKGKEGEREFATLCRQAGLGDVRRNLLDQCRDGGVDIVGVDGWAIEVKRAARFESHWWQQALDQAVVAEAEPLLAYRLDRYQWRCRVRISALAAGVAPGDEWLELSFPGWILLAQFRANQEV